jgi:hypothetical protein
LTFALAAVSLACAQRAHAQTASANANQGMLLFSDTGHQIGSTGRTQVLEQTTQIDGALPGRMITAHVNLQNRGTNSTFIQCSLKDGTAGADHTDIDLGPNTSGSVSLLLASPPQTSGPHAVTIDCGTLGQDPNVWVVRVVATITYVENVAIVNCNDMMCK